MSVEYAIELGDVAQVRSDLLVLKYAQEFYGADAAIASALAIRWRACTGSIPRSFCGRGRSRSSGPSIGSGLRRSSRSRSFAG